MSLFKTDRSPYWQYDFWVENQRFQGSTKRTKRSEAEKVLAKARQTALDRIQLGATEGCSLDEAARLWLRLEGLSSRDARNNQSRVEKLLGSSLRGDRRAGLSPKLPLHSLTVADVRKLADARLAEGNSPATVNRELALIQSIVRCARERGYAVPMQLDLSRLKTRETGKLRWFTVEEEARILDEIDPKRCPRPEWLGVYQDQWDLAVFLLDTGARYSEAATITKDVVDLKRNSVNLYRGKVENEGTLALTSRLRAVLDRRYSDPALRGPYIFPSRTLAGVVDIHRPRGYATSGIRKAIERAGCNAPHLVERYGRASAHTFRDTFAARLAMAGMSLYEIQQLLGHSSPVMTQKYAHLVVSDTSRKAAQVLDSLRG